MNTLQADRVVLILGAGATLADGLHKPLKKRPPLDRGFFRSSLKAHAYAMRPIVQFMAQNYKTDLEDAANDSLERVMAVLYTDTFGGDLEKKAYLALRSLIRVFLLRLARTTNDIGMSKRSNLYRLIVHFLDEGVTPSNLTIVSFNQDIQAEKSLDAIRSTKARKDEIVMRFPGCYRLPRPWRLSSPTTKTPSQFNTSNIADQGIALLKLHGSLNWYSRHYTATPQKRTLFDPSRELFVTTRKSIETGLKLETTAKKKFTFPLVIPPVVHKSGILHKDLMPVWDLALKRLSEADRVVIFGYSCPQNDWESANLICRALNANSSNKRVSVIDPDPEVLLRYIDLGNLANVSYHASASAYFGEA